MLKTSSYFSIPTSTNTPKNHSKIQISSSIKSLIIFQLLPTVSMGQSLNKSESQEKDKENEIEPVIHENYDKYFSNTKDWTCADFYQAVCQIVEEINRTIGRTQFRVQERHALERAYNRHNRGEGKPLTKEQFQKILRELILDTGVSNIGGAKDMLFYLFGVPATALFIKQRLAPKLIPNDVFIPAVTSATVFLLAKLNKL